MSTTSTTKTRCSSVMPAPASSAGLSYSSSALGNATLTTTSVVPIYSSSSLVVYPVRNSSSVIDSTGTHSPSSSSAAGETALTTEVFTVTICGPEVTNCPGQSHSATTSTYPITSSSTAAALIVSSSSTLLASSAPYSSVDAPLLSVMPSSSAESDASSGSYTIATSAETVVSLPSSLSNTAAPVSVSSTTSTASATYNPSAPIISGTPSDFTSAPATPGSTQEAITTEM